MKTVEILKGLVLGSVCKEGDFSNPIFLERFPTSTLPDRFKQILYQKL